MHRHIVAFTIAALAVGGAAWIIGCDSLPLSGSTATEFVSMGTGKLGGAEPIAVASDAVRSASSSVALPDDMLADTPDEAVMVLSASDLSVVVDTDPAGQPAPVARHATITFGLARNGEDACASEHRVGPFELTFEDGEVAVAEESLVLGAGARSVVRNGRFDICIETWADFDGSVSIEDVSFEFGRLPGNEERVTLCHIPPGDPDNAHTITVGASAVDAHLAHGDYLGDCVPDDSDGDDDQDGSDDADDDGDDDSADGDDGDADDDDADDGDADDDDADDDDADDDDADDDDDGDTPPDADGDGVSDEADGCDETPAGETVDQSGCSCSQRDGDGDGMDDCDDACADTGTGLSVDADGCAANQLDDDGDSVMNDADSCPNTTTGETIDVDGCSCSQLDADGDGVTDCDDLCPDTPDGETVDGDGCSASQLTRTVTVPGPTDIYLAGQPDGATATWPLTGWTSEAPEHSPVSIDISTWVGRELSFTATGIVVTGGNNSASPDGRSWVLRPGGLSQVNGLTAMTDYREGTLVGAFLTDDLPTSGLLPYMSSSGMTTTTPLLQHIFVIGSSGQVVIPTGATRLFFGVAEQQGLIIDNSGSFEVTVEAVTHTLLPADPLAATRFYTGDPNDPKDGVGWFDAGEWAFDYDFNGVADTTTTFGAAGDQPLVGDWNGDGLDEIGVMTPSDSGNVWKLDTNGDGVFGTGDETFTYGADADSIAIVGDWDGDGDFELGFTTPDTFWHLDLDGDRTDDAGEALDTEYESSIPVIGDWTGDGISNLANSTSGSYGWRFDLDNDRRYIWGTTYRDGNWIWGDPSQDIGVAGDWDGNGLDDPARVRAGTWSFTGRVQKGTSTATSVSDFGTGKTPVVGSWATVRAVDAS